MKTNTTIVMDFDVDARIGIRTHPDHKNVIGPRDIHRSNECGENFHAALLGPMIYARKTPACTIYLRARNRCTNECTTALAAPDGVDGDAHHAVRLKHHAVLRRVPTITCSFTRHHRLTQDLDQQASPNDATCIEHLQPMITSNMDYDEYNNIVMKERELTATVHKGHRKEWVQTSRSTWPTSLPNATAPSTVYNKPTPPPP
jgi:hypothetical protein